MQATAQHLDLAPPDGGRWRGPMGWALGVHALLVLALTWGVGWQRDTQVVMEAELWSTLPQVTAPRLVAPEPEPPAPPTPPAPKPEVAPPPPPPGPTEAQIALQKKREQLKLQQQKAEEEAKRKAADKAAALKEAERQKREAALAKAKEQEQAQQKKAQEQAARDKQAKQENARQQAQLEAERRKNLERMMGQAGASGASNATGNAQKSSGPSATYAGKLVGRVKPNIVFPDTVPGNPRAEVEVRTLPDGSIVGRKLLKSSGHAAWDDAVLRAIDRTNTLPKDEDGRVPGVIILGFRPLD